MSAEDTRTDEDLLQATPDDPEAFGIFYRRHVDAVLAFFRVRTGDPELAADLMAETFAAALLAVPRRAARRPAFKGRAGAGGGLAVHDRAAQADRLVAARPGRGRGPAQARA